MMVVTIDWPSSGVEYYSDVAIFFNSLAMTQPYLISSGTISRSIGAGSNGIENSTVTVTLNDNTGYFGAKMSNADQFVKGRKLTIYNWDGIAAPTLFTGYITAMNPVAGKTMSITADMMAGTLNRPVNTYKYTPIAPASTLDRYANILFGPRCGDANPIHTRDNMRVAAYRVGAKKYLLAQHFCLQVQAVYGYVNSGDTTLTDWSTKGGYTVLSNTTTDPYYVCPTTTEPADGVLYCIVDGFGVAPWLYYIQNPYMMLTLILYDYCNGLQIGCPNDPFSWYESATWKLTAAQQNAKITINDGMTITDLLNIFMQNFDCDIFLDCYGQLTMVEHNYPALIAASLGIVNEQITVDGSFSYMRDMQNYFNAITKNWCINESGAYQKSEILFNKQDTNGWCAGGAMATLDERFYDNTMIIGGDYSQNRVPAWRYYQRYSRPNIYYTFTISKDAWFGYIQALSLELGQVLTVCHRDNGLYPRQPRPAQITKITINADGTHVTLTCLDLYQIQDRCFLTETGSGASLRLLAPGSARKLT